MTTNLTSASLDLFLAYAEDAGNWSGNPWVDGNVSLDAAGRGNLTDLKRKGLLQTFTDDGDAYRMAAARIDRVEVCWKHTTADFAVSELVPKTGLRAHAEVGEWPTN
jgi:hypothetical protein